MNPADEIEFVAHCDSTCSYCKSSGYDCITMPLERERRIIFKCRKCKESFCELKVKIRFNGEEPTGATVVLFIPEEVHYRLPDPVTLSPVYKTQHGIPRFTMRQGDKINLIPQWR